MRALYHIWAPRIITIIVDPEKIGKIIGPGGKTIRAIQERTGATIDIENDGIRSQPRLRMEYLPPYALELNPAEGVWCHLTAHWMANHALDAVEAIESCVSTEARVLRQRRDLLLSCVRATRLPIRLPLLGHLLRRSQ